MTTPQSVRIYAPLPLPVEITPPGPYTARRREKSGATLVVQQAIATVPCMLDLVAGYNADPTSTNLLFVQLHDALGIVNPGDVPEQIIPVYGAFTPYSFGVETEFTIGLVIALSSTQLTFTPASTAWLSWNANFRVVP